MSPASAPLSSRAMSDRHALESAERRDQPDERVDEHLRRGRRRRRHAQPVGDHPAARVEHRGLQPRTPDIDGQRSRARRRATSTRRRSGSLLHLQLVTS